MLRQHIVRNINSLPTADCSFFQEIWTRSFKNRLNMNPVFGIHVGNSTACLAIYKVSGLCQCFGSCVVATIALFHIFRASVGICEIFLTICPKISIWKKYCSIYCLTLWVPRATDIDSIHGAVFHQSRSATRACCAHDIDSLINTLLTIV